MPDLSYFNIAPSDHGYRFIPEVMISAVGDEIIALCITFLTNSDYIKNPYLKAKLVSLLFHGTWPVYHLKKGVLGDNLIALKFANDHLLHALMKFYIGMIRQTFLAMMFPTDHNQRSNRLVLIPSSTISSIFDMKSSRLSNVSGQMIRTSRGWPKRASM